MSVRDILQAAAGLGGADSYNLFIAGPGASGSTGLNSVANVSSPTQVGADKWLTGGDSAATISANFVIKDDDTLWSWGTQNLFGTGNVGYLGNGEQAGDRSSPVLVGGSDWAMVSNGYGHVIALRNDGTMWAWGDDNFAQLGLSTHYGSRSSPTQIGSASDWAYVAAGAFCSAAIKTNGTLWAWGTSQNGRIPLGFNGGLPFSSPVQVGALTNWATVGLNAAANGFALKTDGTIWTWGGPFAGLGGTNDSVTNKSSPVQIGALSDWAQLGVGENNCYAVKTDGTLWAWGEGSLGRVGDGFAINRSSPVQIGAATDWVRVSGAYHAIAQKSDGSLYGWGRNNQGELGLNNAINRSSPVQIGSGAEYEFAIASRNSLFFKK